ncbi:hypothetical protein GC173_11410 [bacterium]|nr:hypothetical protein [bacterium]
MSTAAKMEIIRSFWVRAGIRVLSGDSARNWEVTLCPRNNTVLLLAGVPRTWVELEEMARRQDISVDVVEGEMKGNEAALVRMTWHLRHAVPLGRGAVFQVSLTLPDPDFARRMLMMLVALTTCQAVAGRLRTNVVETDPPLTVNLN